ncbi:MAG: hypothetical protein JRG71_12115 [Deltaproteobacteria bacterium]|nr:hypothetical protein [Deltaproteobacteria bacterium]
MLSLFHRGLPLYYFILCAILGLSLAWAVTSETSLQLSNNSTIHKNRDFQHQRTQANQPPVNNRIILQRNIFNSNQPANPVHVTPTKKQYAAASQTTTLVLIGTVVANAESLAVINTGQEIEVIHLNTKISNNGTLVKVERDHVVIESKNGQRKRLDIQSNLGNSQHQITARSFDPRTPLPIVQHLGTNRWCIPTTEAKRIRTDISSIIKQVRIDPHVVNGATDGFVIKRIQRNTLLSQMGLKRGDILHAVNGVTLNSPEKGLQIFQQLREAKALSLDLTRAGQTMNFQYEIK